MCKECMNTTISMQVFIRIYLNSTLWCCVNYHPCLRNKQTHFGVWLCNSYSKPLLQCGNSSNSWVFFVCFYKLMHKPNLLVTHDSCVNIHPVKVEKPYKTSAILNTEPRQMTRTFWGGDALMRNQSCAPSPWLPDVSPQCKHIVIKAVDLDKRLAFNSPPSVTLLSVRLLWPPLVVHSSGNPV